MRAVVVWLVVWLLPGVSGLIADDVVVVRGADGEEAFAETFDAQVALWEAVCGKVGAEVSVVGEKVELQAVMDAGGEGRLWVVMVGHGSFDGRESKFNLVGEDLSAKEMGQWVSGTERPLVVVNGGASSAAFASECSGPGRIVVTATKDASESSYAYFGKYFAEAIGDVEGADLDNDGGVSVLEAFLTASRGVKEFYEAEGRIASEEAIIDDNGDGRGTLAKVFEGLRSKEAGKNGKLPDGVRAHQVALLPDPEEAERSPAWKAKRDGLELEVFKLRAKRDGMNEDDYFKQLEELMVRMAGLYGL